MYYSWDEIPFWNEENAVEIIELTENSLIMIETGYDLDIEYELIPLSAEVSNDVIAGKPYKFKSLATGIFKK